MAVCGSVIDQLLVSTVFLNNMQPSTSNGSTKVPRKAKLGRNAMQRVIKELVRKREEHEERINKLLDPNYQHHDTTKTSPRGNYQEFSEMLRKLEVEQPQVLQESIGNLGNHVNLLATVSLKTDYFLVEKPSREQGQLYSSIRTRFPNVRITHHFQTSSSIRPQWLADLVEYLTEEELTQGLFVVVEGDKGRQDFYGTCFERGKYEEILLSKEKLRKDQEQLIVLKEGQANISRLLLTRLLGPLENISFPMALHRLFSYPLKTFRFRQSQALIHLTKTLSSAIQQRSMKAYGVKRSGNTVKIDLSTQKMINSFGPLLHRYSSVLLINETEFPVKSLPLSCLKSHFVVVTLMFKQSGTYYITVANNHSHPARYRLCLLDFEGSIVHHEVVDSGQFILSSLKEEEYEIYISPEGADQPVLEEDESFQLVKESQEEFWLWVQGKGVCAKQGDLQLEIRLKEQYNSYTHKIAMQYLSQMNRENEIQKVPLGGVLVRRFILNIMGLVVDEFNSASKENMTVKYKQANLCDQFFQETILTCSNRQSFVLRAETQIDSISLGRTKIKFIIEEVFF